MLQPLTGTPNYDLGNLKNIEVIRGPGSSIYGADAFNGVISLNTWSASRDTTEAWLEGGSFGYVRANARVHRKVGDDASMTSILTASRVDDQEIPAPFTPSSGAPRREGDITGEYENLSTTHKLNIGDTELALYYSSHEVADSYGLSEVLPLFPNGGHTDGDAEMIAFRVAHTHDFGEGAQLSASAYHTEDSLFGSFGIGENVGEAPRAPSFDWDSEDRRSGASLTLKQDMNDRGTRLLLGYSFDEMETDHLAVGISHDTMIATDARRRTHGLMAQVEQRLMDEAVQLIAGVRRDDYSDFGDHTSPRAAIIFHPTDNTALKLMYGNAYRAPSVNEQSDNDLVKGGGDDLMPEQVDTYEVAWIHADPNWRYRISLYHSDVKDSISLSATEDPLFAVEYSNAISAEAQGIELEAVYRSKAWEVYANASFKRIGTTASSYD